jgi:hypothetical protein
LWLLAVNILGVLILSIELHSRYGESGFAAGVEALAVFFACNLARHSKAH